MNDIYINHKDENIQNIVNSKFNIIDSLSNDYSNNFTYLDLKWIFDLIDNDQLRFIVQFILKNNLYGGALSQNNKYSKNIDDCQIHAYMSPNTIYNNNQTPSFIKYKGYTNTPDGPWIFQSYGLFYNFINNYFDTWNEDKYKNILAQFSSFNIQDNIDEWDDIIENWFYINDNGKKSLKNFIKEHNFNTIPFKKAQIYLKILQLKIRDKNLNFMENVMMVIVN